MNKESVYNKISYIEKRLKNKQFGEFYKIVMTPIVPGLISSTKTKSIPVSHKKIG